MRTAQPLSEDDVLQFLQQCDQEERPSPSLREIAEHVGHTTNISVLRILNRLESKKLIQRDAGKSRSVRLTGAASPKRGLTIRGHIAAGPLAEAIEDDEQMDLGEAYDSETHWGLRVRGDSMVEAHILNGDIAVIRTASTCRDGDIVVAMVDGEATLKRFFKRKDHVLLKPENSQMKPIRVKRVEIRGVLVGLLRSY
jgi:repressor LexA